MGKRSAVTTCVLVALLGLPGSASADDAADDFDPSPGAEYFLDGGVVPFVYGSAAVALGAHFLLSPPDEPRFFSESEGGATVHDDTVPEWAMATYAGAGALLIAGVDRDARWFHLKGYLEAVATTLAVTELTKNVVGRHRPSFAPGQTEDARKSFFSGHASLGAATTVYLGAYLHTHVFAPARGHARFRWWELVPATALAAVWIGVPASRVYDNRHHLSDVVTGTIVGSTAALGFFAYQQARLARARDEHGAAVGSRLDWRQSLVLLPDIENRGLVLSAQF